MTRLLDPTSANAWRHFGERYLSLRHFIDLCDAVGLRSCTDEELEGYERNGWLFPVARLVTPEEYWRAYREAELRGDSKFEIDEALVPFADLDRAINFQIDWVQAEPHDDLRHPIDKAWGSVPHLVKPRDENFRPWRSYEVDLDTDGTTVRRNMAQCFYHHWQIHEVYQVRRTKTDMYREDAVTMTWAMSQVRHGHVEPERGMEAVSQFQHLHDMRTGRYLHGRTPDEDGRVSLTDTEEAELERLLHGDAAAVCQGLAVGEEELYDLLRDLIRLHRGYELSERVKLSIALRYDIWRTLELIEALTGSSTEEIAERARRRGSIIGPPYLQELFPNRRQQAREKGLHILRGLADEEYNKQAASYGVQQQDLAALLNFVERTDLALFAYVLVEVNDAFFSRDSLRAAASYLALKSLASLPESLIRTMALQSQDSTVVSQYHGLRRPTLYNTVRLLLCTRERPIWRAYQRLDQHWAASNKTEFLGHLAHLATLIRSSQTAEQYLAANVALATLLRNFTSHHLLEDSELLQGQYLRSVRAITATILLVWKTAQKHSLL
jgi:hypothetical protein